MDKKLNTPSYTRRCVDKYNKKIKKNTLKFVKKTKNK